MSYYETLGVARTATPDEIKIAYRRKAAQTHTDRPGGDHEAFIQIQKAYDVLSDPEHRQRYDDTGEDDDSRKHIETIVSGLFLAAIKRSDLDGDMVEVVTLMVQQRITELANALTAHSTERSRLGLLKGRVKTTKGRNIFDGLLAAQIGSVQSRIDAADAELADLQLVLTMLANYQDVAPTLPGFINFYIRL